MDKGFIRCDKESEYVMIYDNKMGNFIVHSIPEYRIHEEFNWLKKCILEERIELIGVYKKISPEEFDRLSRKD